MQHPLIGRSLYRHHNLEEAWVVIICPLTQLTSPNQDTFAAPAQVFELNFTQTQTSHVQTDLHNSR
jgi:hypothetical protein